MSDKGDKGDKAEKKGKGGKIKRLLLILVGLLVIGGGGGAAGWFLAGGSAAEAGHAPDPNRPQLVPRDGEHGESAAAASPPAEAGHAPASSGDAAPVDPTRFTATYHQIETPFTSNLNQSDAFVQLSLGVATYYDSRVIDNLRTHEPAVRSAVLMRLSAADELIIATPEGRTQLQRDLTRAINQTLREKTGFGGIDNVYFTSFVVQ